MTISASTPTTVDLLPQEIWEDLFARIDTLDLLRCERVCVSWKRAITQSPTLLAKARNLPPQLHHIEDIKGLIVVQKNRLQELKQIYSIAAHSRSIQLTYPLALFIQLIKRFVSGGKVTLTPYPIALAILYSSKYVANHFAIKKAFTGSLIPLLQNPATPLIFINATLLAAAQKHLKNHWDITVIAVVALSMACTAIAKKVCDANLNKQLAYAFKGNSGNYSIAKKQLRAIKTAVKIDCWAELFFVHFIAEKAVDWLIDR